MLTVVIMITIKVCCLLCCISTHIADHCFFQICFFVWIIFASIHVPSIHVFVIADFSTMWAGQCFCILWTVSHGLFMRFRFWLACKFMKNFLSEFLQSRVSVFCFSLGPRSPPFHRFSTLFHMLC
jgi:hypothetical protein